MQIKSKSPISLDVRNLSFMQHQTARCTGASHGGVPPSHAVTPFISFKNQFHVSSPDRLDLITPTNMQHVLAWLVLYSSCSW